ncbi:MAG TPA: hypothetical protein VH234_04470 [Candidatus Saccharimonadales bacterium]|nr:hypothetical protein [Candidatus Saccharimonadales bacterium]
MKVGIVLPGGGIHKDYLWGVLDGFVEGLQGSVRVFNIEEIGVTGLTKVLEWPDRSIRLGRPNQLNAQEDTAARIIEGHLGISRALVQVFEPLVREINNESTGTHSPLVPSGDRTVFGYLPGQNVPKAFLAN